MDHAAQAIEVDRNYDAFQRNLATYLPNRRGQYALMRSAKVVDFFQSPGDALAEGTRLYADEIFSIQEVTDQPIDLGFFSHVGA